MQPTANSLQTKIDVARRELLGRIAAHGHMVANHTMTHRNFCQIAGDAEAAAEIDENSEVIAQATGVRPLLFRAPYGARCRKLEAALAARALSTTTCRNPSSKLHSELCMSSRA